MPRTKKRPKGSGPVAQLAGELQVLRRAAGLTYDQMAPRVHFSKTTLATADTGTRFPGWPSVEAYVRACGGDLEYYRHRWRETARQLTPVGAGAAARPPAALPDPGTAGGLDDYRGLLHHVRALAGDPPYRTLSAQARRLGLSLPRSTVGDMLSGRSRTVSSRVVAAYLRVCGLSDKQVKLWVQVHADLVRVDRLRRAGRVLSSAEPTAPVAAAGPRPSDPGGAAAPLRRAAAALAGWGRRTFGKVPSARRSRHSRAVGAATTSTAEAVSDVAS